MPELPEVETIKRGLASRLTGKTISNVEVRDSTLLTGHKLNGKLRRRIDVDQFSKGLIGKTIRRFHRRGKYIVMEFSDSSALILHLRMTGQLLLNQPDIKERALFKFADGSRLWFADRRRFGEVIFSADWKNERPLTDLGAEPLEEGFDGSTLKKVFIRRKTPIHSALLNQRLLSGLGNIYAVESLYRAKISPSRNAGAIPLGRLNALSDSIKEVLTASIKNRGYSMQTYVDELGKKGRSQLFTLAYGKEGSPCSFCGLELRRKVITGRGVVYCAACQT